MQASGVHGKGGSRPPAIAARAAESVEARFRKLLERKGGPSGGAVSSRSSPPSSRGSTRLSESPPSSASADGLALLPVAPAALVTTREPEARPSAVRRPARLDAASRLLVGEGPRGTHARIEFRAGPLAGAAIALAAGRSGVEVQLVAAAPGVRDTLARVVNRAEARLKAKGIAMKSEADEARAGGRREGRDDGRSRRDA